MPRLASALDTINAAIGRRMKSFREVQGINQSQAALASDMHLNQWHRFEKGQNRIQASTLFKIAKRFGVPITFFYENLGSAVKERAVFSERNVQLLHDIAKLDAARQKKLRLVVDDMLKACEAERSTR